MHVLKPNALEKAQEADQSPLVIAVADLDPVARWIVYRRLQDLGLTCRYGRSHPLTVAISTPIDALLVWSVVQTATQSKPALADHLDRCWQQRSPR